MTVFSITRQHAKDQVNRLFYAFDVKAQTCLSYREPNFKTRLPRSVPRR